MTGTEWITAATSVWVLLPIAFPTSLILIALAMQRFEQRVLRPPEYAGEQAAVEIGVGVRPGHQPRYSQSLPATAPCRGGSSAGDTAVVADHRGPLSPPNPSSAIPVQRSDESHPWADPNPADPDLDDPSREDPHEVERLPADLPASPLGMSHRT